ncbi:transcriptional regulator [Paenibacillus contaminans]|uniref:Transcriptional regulator n=1 Tax=Paenibacillus contaminans TaxID=450362 RepID=A0A329MCW9_9BACL|nr:transcriptional regulator [Paenibacillus contaminans]
MYFNINKRYCAVQLLIGFTYSGNGVIPLSEFITLLGNRIRQLRKEKGLTQAELGEKMQISQGYIGEIERGLVNVSMETLDKIVKALGITLYELFDFRDIDIDEQHLEKETIIEVHKKMLLERSLSEVKMIHNITKEIVHTIDNNK